MDTKRSVESLHVLKQFALIGICTPAGNHTNDQRLHTSLSSSEYKLQTGAKINNDDDNTNDLDKLAVGYKTFSTGTSII